MAEPDALQVLALLAVIRQDSDYLVRRVKRWYSKTFYTPLHEVDDLPIEDVISAWYEEMYEQMPEKKRMHMARLMTESDEERTARESREEAERKAKSDDAFLEKMRKEQEKEIKALAAKAKKDAEIEARVRNELAELEPLDPSTVQQVEKRKESKVHPAFAPQTAPTLEDGEDHDISMAFDDEGNLLGEDALAAPHK